MKKQLQLLLLCLACTFTGFLYAEASAVSMLEESSRQILGILKQNQSRLKTNPEIINQAVERYLLPKVDVAGMSRSVLGRMAWSKATAAEKAEFSKVFTQLVIRTYANPLAEYTDETIKFLPQKAGVNSRFVRVSSLIYRSKGKTIPLNYSLVLINGQWKVYDLSVEGVSLLQSFRSQFSQALQQSDLTTVIRTLRERSKVAG